MALATNDISAVRNALGPGIMYPTDTLMTFIMVLGVMLYQDWRSRCWRLIPLPFVSFAVYSLGKIVHTKFEERQEQYSALTTRAQENLSGIRVIKAYVREEHEIGLFRSLSWDYLKKNLVLARVQSIMWPLMFLLVGFSLVITLYFGGLRVIDGRDHHRDADGLLRIPGHAHLADDCIRMGDQYPAAGGRLDGPADEDPRHGTGDP